MKKPVIALLLIITLLVLYFMFGRNNEGKESWNEEISKERTEKEDFMKTSSASPFAKDRSSYHGLRYYEPDQDYRVTAKVTKLSELAYVNIGESDGSSKRYLKYATLNFTIKGTPLELLVLKPTVFGQINVLFTAFADETSGTETYGGGRYLDLDFKNANKITLDFNKAYNPYCAYNESFACPLPPKENILPVRIMAGEKVYKEE